MLQDGLITQDFLENKTRPGVVLKKHTTPVISYILCEPVDGSAYRLSTVN